MSSLFSVILCFLFILSAISNICLSVYLFIQLTVYVFLDSVKVLIIVSYYLIRFQFQFIVPVGLLVPIKITYSSISIFSSIFSVLLHLFLVLFKLPSEQIFEH